MNEILIENRKVGKYFPPFIIAEMSANHNQSFDRAISIIEAAAKAGADAIKLQTYTPDTMTLNIKNKEFMISDRESLWNGRNLYELYKEAHTPWEWHKPLFEKARSLGLIPFSSPFDATAVDMLEDLDAPCYKIASFELVDIPLIKKCAATGKPIIMSIGMATEEEIFDAVNAAKSVGCKDIILLKCVSVYPSSPESYNLKTISNISEKFALQAGLSDHSIQNNLAIASVALGATVIEKHLTLSRTDGGVDSAFSIEPKELEDLVINSKNVWQGLGKISYGISSKKEEKNLLFRRSIYVVKNINAGEIFTRENTRVIRPNLGLSPKYYENILGKKAVSNLKKGTPLKHKDCL